MPEQEQADIPNVKNDKDQFALKIIFTNKTYVAYLLSFIVVVGAPYIVYQSSIVDTSN